MLECTVGVVRSRMERPKQYSINMPPSDMGRCFKDLFENEIGCDIVFKVGDDTFNAHKLVLAARSPVFKAQFFGLVGNPDMDTVVVEDVEPSIFRVFLLYNCPFLQTTNLKFFVSAVSFLFLSFTRVDATFIAC